MRDYIEKILGKPPEKITVKDIEDFFAAEQSETAVLEFKSGDVDIIKIYKEVAAFHNTDGGLLIVGAPREDPKHICKGRLTFTKLTGEESLRHKIASNIQPYPIGLVVKEIKDSSGSVLLIDVPQSTNPPHQCNSDGVYYIRVDTESKPSPHGFVQAMFNRRRLPELTSNIVIKHQTFYELIVRIEITNNSAIPAEKVFYFIGVAGFIKEIESESKLQIDTLSGGIRGYAHTDEFTRGILVRSIKIPVELDIYIEDRARYLFFSIGIWSRSNDIHFIYTTFDTHSSKIVSQIRDDGGIENDERMAEFLKLELNRPIGN